jgi:hypothetical protein
MQLAGDFDEGRVVDANDLGMQQREGRGQGKSQAPNQRDGGQSAIGHRFPLAGSGKRLGPMFTGMQEAMLEGPVLGEVVPAVVFVLPTQMPEEPHLPRGESGLLQRGDPDPVVFSMGALAHRSG